MKKLLALICSLALCCFLIGCSGSDCCKDGCKCQEDGTCCCEDGVCKDNCDCEDCDCAKQNKK